MAKKKHEELVTIKVSKTLHSRLHKIKYTGKNKKGERYSSVQEVVQELLELKLKRNQDGKESKN